MNAATRLGHPARPALPLIVLTTILAGCQPPEQPGSRAAALDTAAVVAVIDSMRALYERSVATGDFGALGSMLSEGAVMVGPGGPQWDSLRAASEYPWPPGTELDITPIETVVLSEDWAYDFGTSTATYAPAGESTRRTVHDTYLLLLRRTEDGWKLYREVATPELLPDAAPRR